MQLIAHRGDSHNAPENTLAAVTQAWELPEVAVEIDVHLTVDNKVVVIHDLTTGRTAGKDMVVEASTLGALRTLDYGIWKGRQWEGETIPTLEDVIEVLPHDRLLVVDIKSDARILPALQQVMQEFDLQREQVVFASSSQLTLNLASQALPQHDMILAAESPGESVEQTARNALLINADGIAVRASRALTPEIVQVVHRMGLSLHAWGVDRATMGRRMLHAAVDSCVTDDPRRIGALLRPSYA